jgi:nucleoporin POM152
MTVISGSRGEVTLQPERSGSYVYKFTSLSDANYKQIPLNGPVIKQTVHPLASASFTSAGPGSGGRGGETTVQSCSGDTVTVPVILKGTAPWNLELQVVGPTGTETQKFTGIKTDRHSIKVKIPKDVDKDGGTVLVDLSASLINASDRIVLIFMIVSVEDANGCKRNLNVPGVTVNVRRVKVSWMCYGCASMLISSIANGKVLR